MMSYQSLKDKTAHNGIEATDVQKSLSMAQIDFTDRWYKFGSATVLKRGNKSNLKP